MSDRIDISQRLAAAIAPPKCDFIMNTTGIHRLVIMNFFLL
jgi:hypothetical protein